MSKILRSTLAVLLALVGVNVQTSAQVTTLDEISNSKVYNIQCGRGYMPNGDGTALLYGTTDAANAAKWAFVKSPKEEGVYYIYSADHSKFLKSGAQNENIYSDAIAGAFTLTENGGTFIIASKETTNWLQFGGSKQFVLTDASWKQKDSGNQWTVTEAGAFAEETEVLQKINDYESVADLIPIYDNLNTLGGLRATQAEADDIKSAIDAKDGATAKAIIETLETITLSNYKIYSFVTTRGAMIYYPSVTEEYAYSTGGKTKSDIDATQPNQQWAILTTAKGLYLYNVGAGKFAYDNRDKERVALSDKVQAGDFNLIDNKAKAVNYPWVPAFGEHQLNVSNNYDEPIITFWNDLGDSGNQFRIAEIDDFDPTEALKAIAAFENDIVTPDTPTEISNLTSGWYQIQYIGPGWTASEYNKFIKTVNISDAVLHSSDYYDLQTTDDQTALNTLVYINNTGETGTTKDDIATTITNFTLATGNGVGKGGSRTNFAGNNVGITAPDADQAALGLYFTVSKNYGDVFSKAVGGNTYYPLGAGATQKQVRFNLYKIDVEANYDIYTVKYAAGITGTPKVTYNNAEYSGVTELIQNGVIFVKKGNTLSADDFTSEAVAGIKTEVQIDDAEKTITVAFTGLTPQDMQDAADAAKDIINKRGIGYPTTECTAYTELNDAIAAVEASIATPDKDLLDALTEKVNAYYASADIELPVEGATYRFNLVTSVAAELGSTIGYLTYDDAGIYVNDGTADDTNVLQCTKLVDNRYVFQFKTSGKYLAWKGTGSATSNTGENGNKGYIDDEPTDDALNYASFQLTKLARNGSVVAYDWDKTFGFVAFMTPYRSSAFTTDKGCFVIQEGTKSFNAANAPFFSGAYTSAFSIETVEIPTAINAADAATTTSAIYNLNGQRVAKAQKGLYIINNKKVVVK